jgi:hypothetical protein
MGQVLGTQQDDGDATRAATAQRQKIQLATRKQLRAPELRSRLALLMLLVVVVQFLDSRTADQPVRLPMQRTTQEAARRVLGVLKSTGRV